MYHSILYLEQSYEFNGSCWHSWDIVFWKDNDVLVWFGFRTALPEPALWQFLSALLGLLLPGCMLCFSSKRLPVWSLWLAQRAAPPARWWELVCFIAPGWGFAPFLMEPAHRAAPSAPCPKAAPASLQPVQRLAAVCDAGVLLLTSSSHCSGSVSHCKTHTHTLRDVFIDIYAHILLISSMTQTLQHVCPGQFRALQDL